MGHCTLTDGVFLWPEGLAHYVLEHELWDIDGKGYATNGFLAWVLKQNKESNFLLIDEEKEFEIIDEEQQQQDQQPFVRALLKSEREFIGERTTLGVEYRKNRRRGVEEGSTIHRNLYPCRLC